MLAEAFGFDLLDTGKLYRALALQTLNAGIKADDEAAIGAFADTITDLETTSDGLRTEAVAGRASQISAYPAVRQALYDYQRRFGVSPPSGRGAILDGRDIGTVIFPETPCKIFLTASPEARAKRRTLEMESLGKPADYQAILTEILRRDDQDSTRSIAPLRPAEDSILIDSSALTPEQVFTEVRKALYARGLNL